MLHGISETHTDLLARVNGAGELQQLSRWIEEPVVETPTADASCKPTARAQTRSTVQCSTQGQCFKGGAHNVSVAFVSEIDRTADSIMVLSPAVHAVLGHACHIGP